MTETVTFERWVRISSTLSAAPPEQRDAFLERWGFDATSWAAHEGKWSRELCDDTARGRTDRMEAYAAACVAARGLVAAAPRLLAAAPGAGRAIALSAAVDVDSTMVGASAPHEPTLPFQRRAMSPDERAVLMAKALPEEAPSYNARPAAPHHEPTVLLQPKGPPNADTLPFTPPKRGLP